MSAAPEERMIRYVLREGIADNLVLGMRPVEVRTGAGVTVGRVVRGELAGCERRATFRFEPLTGAATTMGVDVSGVRGKIARLVRPAYRVEHGDGGGTLRDRPGENLLYFALAGTVDDVAVAAEEDWDGSVRVRFDGRAAARIRSGQVLGRTDVDVDVQVVPGDALFGVAVLLVFMVRLYADESGLVEELLDG